MAIPIYWTPGLYEMDARELPCAPTELGMVGKYHIREALNKGELEEAAARVLVPSIELGRWVGVSYRRVGQTFIDDVTAARENLDARNAHVEASWGTDSAKTKHGLLNKATLGLYGKIVAPPAEAEPFVPPHEEEVFSICVTQAMFASNPYLLQGCIQQLVESGLLRHEEVEEDGEHVDILYPTASLCEKILAVKARYAARS